MILKKSISFFFVKIFFVLFCFSSHYGVFANDASVVIVTGAPSQTVKIFSSLADLNANTNPIATLQSDVNSEVLYPYTTSSNTKIYIKSEITATISDGGMTEYILVSGTNNIVSLGVGGSLSTVVTQLENIKGSGFIPNVHSLSQSGTGGLSATDKNEIASLTKTKIEESGSILSQIIALVNDIITRLFSIKGDTQKIK